MLAPSNDSCIVLKIDSMPPYATPSQRLDIVQEEEEDEHEDHPRRVAEDLFGHALPWRLATCADKHFSGRTKTLWPACHLAKVAKRAIQRREEETFFKDMLKRELGEKKSLFEAIGKHVPEQVQHQSHTNSPKVALKGSIVFIKTHKTATEYVTVVVIITVSCW